MPKEWTAQSVVDFISWPQDLTAQSAIYLVSIGIDFIGVGIIAFGAIAGILLLFRDLAAGQPLSTSYQKLRTFLGRSLLLGLEFLVAGDVIKTVAVDPTFDSVIVLAIIVIVRTVLSISIDVEIDGRWPWDAAKQEAALQLAESRQTPQQPERRVTSPSIWGS